MLVSIIVPVYNVEHYIERCARSLYEQTYEDIEYIWVDDATPDHSIDQLKQITNEYPRRKPNVRILEHITNLGPAFARNTGLEHACGEYIYYSDADDWADSSMIEELVNCARLHQADIVWCDFYKSFSNKNIVVRQNLALSMIDCIQCLLSEKMHGAYWNKLISRQLYLKNTMKRSYNANICEDLLGCVQLFYYAQKVSYYPKAFYHYVQDNGQSISTHISSEKHTGLFINIDLIIQFIEEKQLNEQLSNELNFVKLLSKRPYLTSTEMKNFIKWRDTYPEANKYILSYSMLPIKLRVLGWFASKSCWLPIYLWNRLKVLKMKCTACRVLVYCFI